MAAVCDIGPKLEKLAEASSIAYKEQEGSVKLSLTGALWRVREADERQVAACMQRYNLPEILARILTIRNIPLDEVENFLQPSLKNLLPDPSHLLDMDIAAERIASAVIAGERMAILGDYDVDGATSSALLVRFFRALGREALVHIPDRAKEGYGPSIPALMSLKERGAALVITVDCGTLSFEPLAAAHEAGLDVIVIDHHAGSAEKPKALAIVNPNRLDEDSPHKQLAAVGMAFLLTVAVNRKLREHGYFSQCPEPDLKQWLDLVALGTICDVVPLTGVNRALVAQGLKIMGQRQNIGIRTLLDQASVSEKPGVYHSGFVVGPRINAGGRVGKSDLGVRLLTCDDEGEALMLARELEVHNSERKTIEAMVLEQAMAVAEKMPTELPMLLVTGKNWHQGVIGIVAGRLKERFHKPVAVVAFDEHGIGKASARSVHGIDFGAAVIAAREAGLLVAGGGHAMAAGFTVREENLAAFAEFMYGRLEKSWEKIDKQRSITIDGNVSISGANIALATQLERLGPFGQGNPSIRLAVRNVVNLRPDLVGESHVKTLLVDKLSQLRLPAIAFRCKDTKLGEALFATRGKIVDIAGQLRLQEWNGKQNVSLLIDDICAI